MPSPAVRALSEAQQRKFREIHARLIAQRRARDLSDWDFGTDLRAMTRGQLWLAGGYSSFNDYVERAFDMSPSQARGLRTAARFSRDAVERYGWAKLELVVKLWEKLPGEERYADIDAYRFRVPSEAGVVTRTLDQMSKRDVLAAIDLAADETDVARVPAALRRFVTALEHQLEGIAGVRVRSSGSATSPRFAVLGVPLADAARLRDGLSRALRDDTAVRPVRELRGGSSPADRAVPTAGRRPLVIRPWVARRG